MRKLKIKITLLRIEKNFPCLYSNKNSNICFHFEFGRSIKKGTNYYVSYQYIGCGRLRLTLRFIEVVILSIARFNASVYIIFTFKIILSIVYPAGLIKLAKYFEDVLRSIKRVACAIIYYTGTVYQVLQRL